MFLVRSCLHMSTHLHLIKSIDENDFNGCFKLLRTKYFALTLKKLLVFPIAFDDISTHFFPVKIAAALVRSVCRYISP